MGHDGAAHVIAWFDQNISGTTNPRIHGGILTGNHHGEWRYKHDGWRALATFDDSSETVSLYRIGWRSNFYTTKR